MSELIERSEDQNPLPVDSQTYGTVSVSTKEKGTSGCLLVTLLLLILMIPMVVCGFVAFGYLYILGQPDLDSGLFDSNVQRLGQEDVNDYIDPDKHPSINALLEDSEENFSFRFKDGVNANRRIYEREFILANLQTEYAELTQRFGYELPYEIVVKFTDDQEQYEKDFGRSYNYDLSHAGFTTYGEIEFYVNPTNDYDKQDFKRLIAHELVHIYQFDNDSFVFSGTPTWFYEGTAEYLSDAPIDSLYSFDTAPDIDSLGELEEAFNSSESDEGLSAYLVSNHFIHYLAEKNGEDSILNIIKNSDYQNFDSIFIDTYGKNPDALYREWISNR